MVLHAADMRREYSLAGLDETDLDADPILQFGQWFVEAQAAEVPEPNAMVLATASPDGEPAARIVLLKGFDERGFLFYSNYESPKGRDLARNPRAALTFYWPQLERQVRISGRPNASAATNLESISTAVPWEVASRPVSPARARSSAVASSWRRNSGDWRSNSATAQSRYPSTGAATAWSRTGSSSGKGVPAGSTTGSAIAARATTGSSSACRPNLAPGRLSLAAPSSALRPPRRAHTAD